jgi:hypothetical protein
MKTTSRERTLGAAAVAVFGITSAVAAPVTVSAAPKAAGKYMAGDFHNHTTCSDGSTSIQKLVKQSVEDYGLEWFIQVGHGGSGSRNCTLAEDPLESPDYPSGGQPASSGKGPNQTWTDTIGNARIAGNVSGTTARRNMWRWQIMQEFMYPVLEAEARKRDMPIFLGVESIVPGHEHVNVAILDGQLPASGNGNADAISKWEYCFDRADTDTSRGNFLGTSGPNNWDCSVPGSTENGRIDPNARKILTNSGIDGHIKSLEGVKLLGALYPNTSFYVPAHIERAGVFSTTASRGWDINHIRDYHNAAPTVAFGFETMPGHQAEANRGNYGRSAAGGGTFGGTGAYGAIIGGVWDTLLSEGRNWWFFASSDWHNRGLFGSEDRRNTLDFMPGEYHRNYTMIRGGKPTMQSIVDGLRDGNTFVANGGIIDRLSFVACASYRGIGFRSESQVLAAAMRAAQGHSDVRVAGCANMGEKLVLRPGAEVVVAIVVRDPAGKNFSPYSFPNPSLKQIGITQPLDEPVLDHIDVIGGSVTGYVAPTSALYAGPIGSAAATNSDAALQRTFNASNWTATADGYRSMVYRMANVRKSQFIRLRGANMPPAVPNETDAQGNPLLDFVMVDAKLPCPECPEHMTKDANGQKVVSYDVAAWADLWFYSNPIYMEVSGSTRVAGVK